MFRNHKYSFQTVLLSGRVSCYFELKSSEYRVHCIFTRTIESSGTFQTNKVLIIAVYSPTSSNTQN